MASLASWSEFLFQGFYNCALNVNDILAFSVPFVNCILKNGGGNSQVYRSVSTVLSMTNCIVVGYLRNTSKVEDGDYVPAIPGNIVCTAFGGETSTIAQEQFLKVTTAAIEEAYGTSTLRFKGVKTALFTDRGVNVVEPAESMAKDIEGIQRIYNGAADIGPNEYDWRRDFSSAIGGVTVKEASPGVTTNALGKVRLPDGASIDVVPTSLNARRITFAGEKLVTAGA